MIEIINTQKINKNITNYNHLLKIGINSLQRLKIIGLNNDKT